MRKGRFNGLHADDLEGIRFLPQEHQEVIHDVVFDGILGKEEVGVGLMGLLPQGDSTCGEGDAGAPHGLAPRRGIRGSGKRLSPL